MKIIDKEIDEHKNNYVERRSSRQKSLKSKTKDSILVKGKGRISVPNEPNDHQIQPNYEDLRKMPFSFGDEDVNHIHSPMQRFMSVDDEYINPNSMQMEAQEDDQLADWNDDEVYGSFDIFHEEISKFENDNNDEIEVKGKKNNITDCSNLYLNLNNNVIYPETVIIDKEQAQHEYKIRQILHTTAKSNHRTGENLTYSDWFKTKTKLNKKLQQNTHEISIDSISDNKSFWWNKVWVYSEFDEQNEKESNVTDFRHTLINNNKIKNIRPGIIKGFCSSSSSSKSKNKNQDLTPEKEINIKPQFYNSGIDFHSTGLNYKSNYVNEDNRLDFNKSFKQAGLDFRLSVDSSVEENRSYGIN